MTEDLTLTARWTVCDHRGSTLQPTCTDAVKCTVCGGTGGKSSPATFDAALGVYGVTAVTSLAGLALLRRKRRDDE